MNRCNCTSYVAWALTPNGQRTAWFTPGDMDANNWPHVASLSNLRVGRRPRVGAVGVWPRLFPPCGHVAYVPGVDNDGTFDVAEYSFAAAAYSRPFAFDQREHVPVHGAILHLRAAAELTGRSRILTRSLSRGGV
jgi:surface antigen